MSEMKAACTDLTNARGGEYVVIASPNGNEWFGRIAAVDGSFLSDGSRWYEVDSDEFAVSYDGSGYTMYAMYAGQEDELL